MESAVDFFRDLKLIKRLLVTAQITFSRKPFRVHGRLEYDKVN